jgi:hypothetical protein
MSTPDHLKRFAELNPRFADYFDEAHEQLTLDLSPPVRRPCPGKAWAFGKPLPCSLEAGHPGRCI